MRFLDFYQPGKVSFSIEVFPPKTSQGAENLFTELKELQVIAPKFISVTYGAMGSTRDLTQDLAVQIFEKLKCPTAFHFTCVGSNREEIRQYITELANRGVKLVVALRGDIPPEMGKKFRAPIDGFRYASELVAYLREFNRFSMAVAGYPEKHIEAASFESDLENLQRKVTAGGEIIITQLFFDNADYYKYVARVRTLGITVPIVPGILPIQSCEQIERLTKLCGAKLPKDLHHRLLSCGEDKKAMQAIGIDHATKQCRDLIQNGAPGIHFYSLNKAGAILQIVENCR